MIISDRIYKNIEITGPEERLFEFPSFTRLRYVSQSNNSFFSPTSNTPTRLEHSLGVYYLAKVLSDKKDFREVSLYLRFAALLHDLGHPPFGHASEPILEEITGMDHEEFSGYVIESSGIGSYMRTLGLEPARLTDLISGKEKPFGDLFNGSIDLDNLDNIIRWGTAVGLDLDKYYDPIKIANSFSVMGGKLTLGKESVPEVEHWLKARHAVYSAIDEGEIKSVDMMVRKALAYAALRGDIKKDFFLLTDYEAMVFLKNSNNSSKKIIESLESCNVYKKVYKEKIDPEIGKNIRGWRKFFEISNAVARKLGIAEGSLMIHVAPYKGSRIIHLPVKDSPDIVFGNEVAEYWDMVIISAEDVIIKQEMLNDILKDWA